jgi:hypothetical protein
LYCWFIRQKIINNDGLTFFSCSMLFHGTTCLVMYNMHLLTKHMLLSTQIPPVPSLFLTVSNREDLPCCKWTWKFQVFVLKKFKFIKKSAATWKW